MSEVRLARDANTEPDIAGYQLYAGTVSGNYDAIGSPKNMGNVLVGGFDIDQARRGAVRRGAARARRAMRRAGT